METISAKDLDWYVGRHGYLLIDLRTRAEFLEGHIRGALNAPDGERYSCLNGHFEDILVLYCDRGAKSLSAARELEEKGWRTISVVGGIRAYRGHNLTAVPGKRSENMQSEKDVRKPKSIDRADGGH